MGMTAARLRERKARGYLSPKAPPPPSSIPYAQHEEVLIEWRKRVSGLETRITELEAELSLLKRPISELPPTVQEPAATKPVESGRRVAKSRSSNKR